MFEQPIVALGAFVAAAVVITLAGIRMSGTADELADRTGLGEALIGGILLGASTSLSGTVTSVTAAYGGYASLAVSNAIGGIAAQTVFLAIADLIYRRSNLEHAAASETNLIQGALLVVLLAIPALAMVTPEFAIFAIHPVTPILLAAYIYGLRLTHAAQMAPMWSPRKTRETRDDVPEEPDDDDPSTKRLVAEFAGLLAAVGFSGWILANSAVTISEWAGLSQTLVGTLFTAITTSLPELVTTIAAVRRGALQLAVGGIIGGNTFDVLFLVGADVAYRDGSIFHAVGEREVFLLVWSILMTGILLLGLIRREKHGVAGIGFESAALLAVFGVGVAIQVALG
ncbi:sodium:calcium antiporter [Amorphus orientalis]|uniref:Cation:H+ antiporter n=1 Tax=Amorphus orientalis TaxID=649198 RepID=A0AAE3VKY7_9HYPH|nr:sodium:calcium antiporter [Amorphus orientalis]MDQ0313705.1 cation:H+ antiporter [Amorphus orientalis]